MRLCWCDRIGVGWSIIVLGLLGMAGAFGDYRDVDAGHNLAQAFYVFILPVWGFFRVIDLLGGGPWSRMARRRGTPRVTIMEPRRY